MNQPVDVGIRRTYEELPIASIAPSSTTTQARRRARFHGEALSELVRSVQLRGVIEPILVVPHPEPTAHVRFELVAGERRWLAAKAAGLGLIPAIVTNIERDELVQFQLIENRQRETLHPLDEAEAFAEICRITGRSKEDVADDLGISRAQVYARLKLLELDDEVAKALEEGKLPHSHALRIARLPGKKIQRKALKLALTPRWDGKPLNDRDLGDALRDKFMVKLQAVPFALDDATLNPERGACTRCPHFSENDAELQAELNTTLGIGARICTDKPCHDAKAQAHFARVIDKARAEGRRVIDGAEAKAIKPDRFEHYGLKGYIALDSECNEPVAVETLERLGLLDDDRRNPTYRELLAGTPLPTPDLLVDPFSGTPRDVIATDLVRKALKKAGVDLHDPDEDDTAPAAAEPVDAEARESERAKAAEQERRRQAREEVERCYRSKLLELVYKGWKGALKRDELQAVADKLLEVAEVPSFMEQQEGTNTARMNEQQLSRLLFAMTAGLCVDYLGDSPAVLLAAAKRFRIDPKKVRKEVEKALGAEEPAPAKKAAGKKKAKRK